MKKSLVPVLLLFVLLLSGCGEQAAPKPEETAPVPAEQEEQMMSEPVPEEQERKVPELDENAVVEQLGAVLTIDNAGYEYYNFKLETADRYAAALSTAAEELEGTAQVYSLIIPNSMGICVPESLQKEVNTSDQKAAIDYLYGSMGEGVRTVPVYDTLLEHYLEGEYLYFRTDHHWTTQGAYRAYEQFAGAAGFAPAPLEDFIPHEFDGFLGSFYNAAQSKAMEETPDTVIAYESPSTNHIRITNEEMTDWLYVVIGDVEEVSAGNKYTTFIGGDNPYSLIENPDRTDGSSVLLVKDSYGNAFAPFLIESYQQVHIVDFRYFSRVDDRSLKELALDLGVDDVLFLNNISTTRSDKLVEKLEAFIGA